ncbi:MAG: hypothetical protein IT426_18895 [Pirellulales bacterium]|nr:hypothetical protein [Pirellulales bacterium]
MNTIHAGGGNAFRAAIRAEYAACKQELIKLLREAGSERERGQLAEELRELEAKFRAQTAHWRYRLF